MCIRDSTWSGPVEAARFSGLASKTDGTLWAWGNNSSGNLGDSSRTQRSSPVQVLGTGYGTNAYDIAYSGDGATGLVVKTNGELWAWGYGNYGTLAQNTGAESLRSSPVQIPGTDWYQVSNTGGRGQFATTRST